MTIIELAEQREKYLNVLAVIKKLQEFSIHKINVPAVFTIYNLKNIYSYIEPYSYYRHENRPRAILCGNFKSHGNFKIKYTINHFKVINFEE